MTPIQQDVINAIRDIPDFPKKGIIFKDITTLLARGDLFRRVVDEIADHYSSKKIDMIVGIESRGFIFGAALAYKLGAGIVPVRKKGKLPHKTIAVTYALEYGTDTLEIHADALEGKKHVLIVDDLLATGGTAKATAELVQKCGGHIEGCAFVVELAFLKGRQNMNGHEIYSLIQY
ncbi:MAG: adenine phosphoribosyltransferase [Elusimicrobia bacterium RIFCSPLOWO2_01_FULL_54_10]|nr:MAG: adenine phosphoribosyltransferase [Elusimicrobia bacterium RIFCSPLOWO2_01_FULL_54_10]